MEVLKFRNLFLKFYTVFCLLKFVISAAIPSSEENIIKSYSQESSRTETFLENQNTTTNDNKKDTSSSQQEIRDSIPQSIQIPVGWEIYFDSENQTIVARSPGSKKGPKDFPLTWSSSDSNLWIADSQQTSSPPTLEPSIVVQPGFKNPPQLPPSTTFGAQQPPPNNNYYPNAPYPPPVRPTPIPTADLLKQTRLPETMSEPERYVLDSKHSVAENGSFLFEKRYNDKTDDIQRGYFKDINGTKIFVVEGQYSKILPSGQRFIVSYFSDERGYVIQTTIQEPFPMVPFVGFAPPLPEAVAEPVGIRDKALNVLLG